MYSKIKASYSFWSNPIKWVREIKLRKNMNKLLKYEMENGMEEKVQKSVREVLINGYTVL